MNPIIKDQLERCKVAQLPAYSDEDTLICIPKGAGVEVSPYQVHKCYLMELADWIIHPSDDFTLAANWNKGSVPKSSYYLAEISQVMGKMVKITGRGYDITTNQPTLDMWEGWLPQKGIKLIKELK